MALELEDFQKPTLTLDDLISNKDSGVPLNNKTASQLAASTALVTNPSLQTYRQLKEDLLDPVSRERFLLQQQAIRDSIWKDSQGKLLGLISDPTVSDQDKLSAVDNVNNDKLDKYVFNTMNTLAERAALTDFGEDKSEEAVQSENILIDSISKMNKQKKTMTSLINSLHLGEDSNALTKAKDFGELLVPLAEWLHVSQFGRDLNSGESLDSKLMGNMKKEIFDKFKNTSVDQREALAKAVIDIYQNNENIILPDGNDIEALHILETMLVTGDYSDTERYIDNIVSVLDVVGVGGFLRGVVKGGKTAKIGAELSKEAKAFKASELPTDAKLAEEAQAFKPEVPATDTNLAAEAQGFKPEAPVTDKALANEASQFKPETDPTVESVFGEARTEAVRTEVSPSSPSQVVKDVNPEQAREFHRIMSNDPTDEAAEAMYGSSKAEALAKDILPEPEAVKGSMQNKVEMRRPSNEKPLSITKLDESRGYTIVSNSEMKRVNDKIIKSFEDVEGMALHPSSLVIKTDPDMKLGITARYSPLDSGLATPKEAFESAKHAFRNYKLKDEDFTLLVRQGDKWVESSVKDAEARQALKGAGAEFDDVDYAIGIKYDYKFSPEDLDEVDWLTTGGSLISNAIQKLDKIPTQLGARLRQGSLVENLLDPSSVIHPQIVNAMSVASDRAVGYKKAYIELFKDFTDAYGKSPVERRAMMSDYIHQANFEGIPFDVTDLYNRGFNESEVKALKVWRRANDAMWYGANEDMVRTLRIRGYKTLYHADSETKLIGRPIAARDINSRTMVYDPIDNSIRTFTPEELDSIYETKGSLIKFGSPAQIDGQWVEHAISRNTPESGYLRELADDEIILNYRDGYYPVTYDANIFVEKAIKVDGQERWIVVGASKNTKDADFLVSRLQKTDPDTKFKTRLDRRFGSNELNEDSWQTFTNSGLSSQKVRGQRLIDAGSDLEKAGNGHLLDPLEAVNRQIHRLSSKTAMRPYIETAKRRWLLQYGKYLDLPINTNTGRRDFPLSVKDIKGSYPASNQIVSEARTNYNYIYSLENGYINGIDKGWTAIAHFLGSFAAEKGLSKAEAAMFSLGDMSPSRGAKSLMFKTSISVSPVRQALIQRGQLLTIGSINPEYMLRLPKDLINIDLVRAGVSKDKEYLKLFEEIKDAGLIEAVDAHTFLRDRALRLADTTALQKVGSVVNKPIEFLQKVGFDAAEQDILIGSWLAHRDLAIKAGKNMKSARVREEILGQARTFMLNMNKSGEMAYTHNTLSVVSQFFSFRHKALLQPFTNRALSKSDKMKLLATQTALFGIDTSLIYMAIDWAFMNEDVPNELKDKLKDGLVDIALNEALTLATGEDQEIDFGDLAPAEAYGTTGVVMSLLKTDIAEAIAKSPSGSLLFGNNAKLTESFKTAMRYFVPYTDYDDPELETKYSDVVIAAMNMFSGFSSVFKGRYAFKTGQKMSSTGRITDRDVTGVEAVAQGLFGLRTKTEEGNMKTMSALYGDTKESVDNDVVLWYKELKRQLARRGQSVAEADMARRILSEAWNVFGDDRPRAVSLIMKEIEKDARNGDFVFIKSLMSQIGVMTDSEFLKVLNQLPPGLVRDRVTKIWETREGLKNGSR